MPSPDEAGPSTSKRARIENSPPSLPQRSSKYWLSDGNVILSVGSTLYKVHKSVLLRSSVIFADMFAIGSDHNSVARNDEGDGELPTCRLEDREGDWDVLLSFLYDTQAFSNQSLALVEIRALMTLGKKYEFEHLVSWATETFEGMCSELLERDGAEDKLARRALWMHPPTKEIYDEDHQYLLYPLIEDFPDVPGWSRFLVALLEMARAQSPKWVGRILYEMSVESFPSFKLLMEWSKPTAKRGATMIKYDWDPVLATSDIISIVRGATRLRELELNFRTIAFFPATLSPALAAVAKSSYHSPDCRREVRFKDGNGLVAFQDGKDRLSLRRQVAELKAEAIARLKVYRNRRGVPCCVICVYDPMEKLLALEDHINKNLLEFFLADEVPSFEAGFQHDSKFDPFSLTY